MIVSCTILQHSYPTAMVPYIRLHGLLLLFGIFLCFLPINECNHSFWLRIPSEVIFWAIILSLYMIVSYAALIGMMERYNNLQCFIPVGWRCITIFFFFSFFFFSSRVSASICFDCRFCQQHFTERSYYRFILLFLMWFLFAWWHSVTFSRVFIPVKWCCITITVFNFLSYLFVSFSQISVTAFFYIIFLWNYSSEHLYHPIFHH